MCFAKAVISSGYATSSSASLSLSASFSTFLSYCSAGFKSIITGTIRQAMSGLQDAANFQKMIWIRAMGRAPSLDAGATAAATTISACASSVTSLLSNTCSTCTFKRRRIELHLPRLPARMRWNKRKILATIMILPCRVIAPRSPQS